MKIQHVEKIVDHRYAQQFFSYMVESQHKIVLRYYLQDDAQGSVNKTIQ